MGLSHLADCLLEIVETLISVLEVFYLLLEGLVLKLAGFQVLFGRVKLFSADVADVDQ